MNSPQTPQEHDRVEVHPPAYPMLARVVRYGDQASVVLAVGVLGVGTVGAWQTSSAMLALLAWGAPRWFMSCPASAWHWSGSFATC